MIPQELASLVEDLERLGPLASFPWHGQQRAALASATNVTVILGGNRSGKTTAAEGIVSRLVRREGPIYRRLRRPNARPLTIWVCPQLFEKYKSNWERRLVESVFAGMDVSYSQTPQPVFRWDDACAQGNAVYGKSQDQGFLAFESDEVDLVVFDEEPKDPRLYTSAQQRLATTNGVIVLAFTPLLGMSSWTNGHFYVPTVRPEYKIADRVWRRGNDITVIMAGMADNPEAVAGGGVARLQNDPAISDAEKRTRLFGEYGFTQGLVLPEFAALRADNDDSPFLLDELPKDRTYSWFLTCDPNKRNGGLLSAIDHENNRYYVAEHYAEGLPDRLHAEAYRAMLRPFGQVDASGDLDPLLGVYADPGGAGSQAIVNLADNRIFAAPVRKDPGSVKASIELIRRAAWIDPNHVHPVTGRKGAPHVYFLRSLRSQWEQSGVEYNESRLMWELRQYRQKEAAPPDTPIKELDDLVDCARYLELARPYAPADTHAEAKDPKAHLDSLSRRATEDFEQTAKRAMRPRVVEHFW